MSNIARYLPLPPNASLSTIWFTVKRFLYAKHLYKQKGFLYPSMTKKFATSIGKWLGVASPPSNFFFHIKTIHIFLILEELTYSPTLKNSPKPEQDQSIHSFCIVDLTGQIYTYKAISLFRTWHSFISLYCICMLYTLFKRLR